MELVVCSPHARQFLLELVCAHRNAHQSVREAQVYIPAPTDRAPSSPVSTSPPLIRSRHEPTTALRDRAEPAHVRDGALPIEAFIGTPTLRETNDATGMCRRDDGITAGTDVANTA